jgi:putative sterol carrier protein
MSSPPSRASSRASAGGSASPRSPRKTASRASSRQSTPSSAHTPPRPVRTAAEVRAQYAIKTHNILELREAKARAIKGCDYERSEGLQILIDDEQNSIDATLIASLKKWLDDQLTETFSRFHANLAAIDDRRAARESDAGKDTQSVRAAMQARHVDQLTKLETDRELALWMAQRRSTLDYHHAIRHSQVLASHDEVGEAIAVKNEADATLSARQEEWEQQTNRRFDGQRAALLKRQVDELVALEESLKENIAQVEASYHEEVRLQRTKMRVWLQRTVQMAIAKQRLELHRPGEVEGIAEELTQYLTEYLKEHGEESLLQLE